MFNIFAPAQFEDKLKAFQEQAAQELKKVRLIFGRHKYHEDKLNAVVEYTSLDEKSVSNQVQVVRARGSFGMTLDNQNYTAKEHGFHDAIYASVFRKAIAMFTTCACSKRSFGMQERNHDEKHGRT